jgi:hypothetical protein
MDYQKIYDNLMLKARSENRKKGCGVYYEAHHIIPKCMGGEGKYSQWRQHLNIILLTAREHLFAHKLLCEVYPKNPKIWFALHAMLKLISTKSVGQINMSSREYERYRETFSKFMSIEKSGENNPFFGKKRPDQSEKMKGDNNPMKREENKKLFRGKKRPDQSERMKGDKNHMKSEPHVERMRTNNPSSNPEVAQKISNALKGKPKSEEHKQKLKKPKTEEHKKNLGGPKPKIECPHCKMMGAPSPMKRFHFDNCKSK